MTDMLITLGYIDPGTGSFLLQILVASLLGGMATAKFYWGRIRGFFARADATANVENTTL